MDNLLQQQMMNQQLQQQEQLQQMNDHNQQFQQIVNQQVVDQQQSQQTVNQQVVDQQYVQQFSKKFQEQKNEFEHTHRQIQKSIAETQAKVKRDHALFDERVREMQAR